MYKSRKPNEETLKLIVLYKNNAHIHFEHTILYQLNIDYAILFTMVVNGDD